MNKIWWRKLYQKLPLKSPQYRIFLLSYRIWNNPSFYAMSAELLKVLSAYIDNHRSQWLTFQILKFTSSLSKPNKFLWTPTYELWTLILCSRQRGPPGGTPGPLRKPTVKAKSQLLFIDNWNYTMMLVNSYFYWIYKLFFSIWQQGIVEETYISGNLLEIAGR